MIHILIHLLLMIHISIHLLFMILISSASISICYYMHKPIKVHHMYLSIENFHFVLSFTSLSTVSKSNFVLAY